MNVKRIQRECMRAADIALTMTRTLASDPDGNGNPLLVHVWILTVCEEGLYYNFLPWYVYSLKTASWQRLLLPRLAHPASSIFILSPCYRIYLYIITLPPYLSVCKSSPPYTIVCNKHAKLLGCCSFSIREPILLDCSFFLCLSVCHPYFPFSFNHSS